MQSDPWIPLINIPFKYNANALSSYIESKESGYRPMLHYDIKANTTISYLTDKERQHIYLIRRSLP